jgi:hypothetical protein
MDTSSSSNGVLDSMRKFTKGTLLAAPPSIHMKEQRPEKGDTLLKEVSHDLVEAASPDEVKIQKMAPEEATHSHSPKAVDQMTEATAVVFNKTEGGLQTHDAARLRYLHRLTQQQVWVPRAQRPPDHQTVICFDWDDTLLCTSWLNYVGDQFNGCLLVQDIERAAVQLLELAMELGRVFIITNAEEGWVEHSAARWVPGLLPVLARVPIISARTKFEIQHPAAPSRWKVSAFFELQKQLAGNLITNLLSVGDSQFEMDAAYALAAEFDDAIVKTIKFQERPKPGELLKQLKLVAARFQRIVEHGSNLTIGVARATKPSHKAPCGQLS